MQIKNGSEMVNAIESITDEELQDPDVKERLHSAARRLLYRTESTHDLTSRIYFSNVPLTVAKLGVDLKVFDILASAPGKSWTPSEIAQQAGCDEVLLVRILRGLVAFGLAAQNSDNTYSSNQATTIFSQEGIKAGIDHNVLNVSPCVTALPNFLKASGYVDPVNPTSTAFHAAFSTTLPPFEFIAKDEIRLAAVAGYMQTQRMGQKSWIEDESLFPAETISITDADAANGRAVFVDVGGGVGHQAIALKQKYPNLKGRVVVQERPEVVASAEAAAKGSGVEFMAHDFETPQPVASKVYYMRNVLHDWTEPTCINILTHLGNAMANDSRVIIDEFVVREVPNWKQVNLDLSMASVLAARERTAQQWKELLEKTGLKIERIVEYDSQSGDSLVIAAPAV